ncbi:hypothetical protein MMC28_010079 [Mycoblastus sanguinarius]|nr:hypothetical protein [Mycoblastus sanguinarius]
MSCITISDANPDIAGTGVVLAFALQALISLLLSIAAYGLETPAFHGTLESVANYEKKKELLAQCILWGSDAQTLIGM